MPAVGRHVWMQSRWHAVYLGPDIQTAVGIPGSSPLVFGASIGAVQHHVAVIFRNPLSPARLQQQGSATLQTDKGAREILDIEGAVLHPGFAHERRHRAAFAPWTELRVRRRSDGPNP